MQWSRILGLGLAALLWGACAPLSLGPLYGPASVRLSGLARDGDPARRASMRLTLKAIDADAVGDPHGAAQLFDRALQVDPTNPYTYLALARHLVEGPDAHRALPFLEKSEALLDSEEWELLEAHLTGLRGAALVAVGRPAEGEPMLARARELDPTAWGDGYLAPGELR